jgi:hypothetical protein
MKPISLEKLEANSRPDPKHHWIFPGAVQAGAKIVLNGRSGIGKSLIASELAISATTCTPFLGLISPWIVARTFYLAGDSWKISTNMRKLLGGRDIDTSPHELLIVPSPPKTTDMHVFWGEIEEAAANFQIRLLIIDRDSDFTSIGNKETIRFLKQSTQNLAQKGVTVLLCTRNPEPWIAWSDAELSVKKDPVKQVLYLSSGNKTIISARTIFNKKGITFKSIENKC